MSTSGARGGWRSDPWSHSDVDQVLLYAQGGARGHCAFPNWDLRSTPSRREGFGGGYHHLEFRIRISNPPKDRVTGSCSSSPEVLGPWALKTGVWCCHPFENGSGVIVACKWGSRVIVFQENTNKITTTQRRDLNCSPLEHGNLEWVSLRKRDLGLLWPQRTEQGQGFPNLIPSHLPF